MKHVFATVWRRCPFLPDVQHDRRYENGTLTYRLVRNRAGREWETLLVGAAQLDARQRAARARRGVPL